MTNEYIALPLGRSDVWSFRRLVIRALSHSRYKKLEYLARLGNAPILVQVGYLWNRSRFLASNFIDQVGAVSPYLI